MKPIIIAKGQRRDKLVTKTRYPGGRCAYTRMMHGAVDRLSAN